MRLGRIKKLIMRKEPTDLDGSVRERRISPFSFSFTSLYLIIF